jgi:xanthine dehydrogenase YagR molybdenum-binding subunit
MADPAPYDPVTSQKLGDTTIIGKPLDRVDGIPKVSGKARYAYEETTGEPVAYGFIVEAAIARGRISRIDSADASAVPGVLLVLTHLNAPRQAPFGPAAIPNRLSRARPLLNDANVLYYGQPVALVVATTFEIARQAAYLVRVAYQRDHADLNLKKSLDKAYRPNAVGPGYAADTSVGDFDSGFAGSKVQIDVTYSNGYQNHNPMEPHAALAIWEGDRLTVHASQQQIVNARQSLASTLQIPLEKARIVSRYVGGGFGSKLPVNSELVLAAMAAKMLGRPVKVGQTRQQMFSNTGHRPAFEQRVRLGANENGQLDAISHEVWLQTSRFDEYAEQAATVARSLYAAPNRQTRHRLVPLDIQHGESMRAPGEAPGLLAVECAMDELAVQLNMDPVELRIRNEPKVDPERGVPFSSRQLVHCLQQGAERFGWSDRPTKPRSRREGRLLIGFGMSAGIRPNKIGKSAARVSLRRDGGIIARLDMTDIGTGSYTILTQIVAEMLGVSPDAVTVELGDSNFPTTTGSGGSLGAGSSGSALYNACVALREAIIEAATHDAQSSLYGSNSVAAKFERGGVTIGANSERLAQIAQRAPNIIEAEGSILPSDNTQRYAQFSYGAYFTEVQVDVDTAEIRARRMLGVFDTGRILNERTARSQLIGGMVWGLSAALHEEGVIDDRYGQFVNRDLAGYHFPVHADMPQIDVVWLDGRDDTVNPLGSKGLGELSICGSGAAIANAVYNATGIRVRSFPVTLDKLLPSLTAEAF